MGKIMSNAKYWSTRVADVQPETVYLRGHDINRLIERLPFAATCFLTVRCRMPSPSEARVMDALLNSTLDYGLFKPGTAAARFVVSANPNMVAGLAASVLACGEYTLAPENAGRFIIEAYRQYKESGKSLENFAQEFVAHMRANKIRAPGFGHPNFEYVDPRAQTLKNVAVEEGVWGEMGDCYEAIHKAFVAAIDKPKMPINDMGMVALIMAELGFEPEEMNGISLISAFPGVIAHISEELRARKPIRVIPDDDVDYDVKREDTEDVLSEAGWDTAGYRSKPV
jgi:citrate synthase